MMSKRTGASSAICLVVSSSSRSRAAFHSAGRYSNTFANLALIPSLWFSKSNLQRLIPRHILQSAA